MTFIKLILLDLHHINIDIKVYDYKMTSTLEQYNSNIENETLSVRPDINQSLTLELLNSRGEVINTNSYDSVKIINTVSFQNLKLFNFIRENLDKNSVYYLKISGRHKLGYYGISLSESTEYLSNAQILNIVSSYKFTQINTSEYPFNCSIDSLNYDKKIYSRSHQDNILLVLPILRVLKRFIIIIREVV